MKKVCRICGEEKDYSEFYKKSETGSPKYCCKVCDSLIGKQRRSKTIPTTKKQRIEFLEHHRELGTLTKCNICGEEKLIDEFAVRNRRGRLMPNSSACKTCDKWRLTKQTFGVTKEEYLSRLEDQNYRCAICGQHLDDYKIEDVRKREWFSIDHDHETGIVRGLLCAPCNTGLGGFKDSKTALEAAIKYLGDN